MDIVTINQVLTLLDNNKSIDTAVKDNMRELIILFNEKFANVSLNNLARILPNLSIIKSNKFVNRRIFKYNIKDNILEFNVDIMNDGFDMKHVMMSAILSLIACDGEKIGFNIDNKFEALQAGYIEMLTNLLVGNDSDNTYLEDEVISVNLLCNMIDTDILFKAFFEQDASIITQALIDEGVEIA